MSAVEVLPPEEAVHGNDRWYKARREGITASEIAVVLGISPHGSPFSLYWQKLNDWRDDGNVYTSAGRHLEAAIAEWWAAEMDPLENMQLRPAGLYANSERPWQLATPDRLIYSTCPGCDGDGLVHEVGGVYTHCPDCRDGTPGVAGDRPVALLECKWVAYSWDGWGEEGTDEIPVYYRAQALWQLDTLGVDEVHFSVLGPGGFRPYGPIRRDEKDLRVMRGAGAAFHRRLTDGDPPDIDGHVATAAALKRLHPDVGEGPVEVPVELAEGYRRARLLKKRVGDRLARYEARLRDALGSEYSRAECGGRLVASRSVFERRSEDEHELLAIDDGWPVTDRLNPGRAKTYA